MDPEHVAAPVSSSSPPGILRTSRLRQLGGNRAMPMPRGGEVAITPARTSPPARASDSDTARESSVHHDEAITRLPRAIQVAVVRRSDACGSSSLRRAHRRPCAADFAANDLLRYAGPATRKPRRRANLIVGRDLSRMSEATIAKPQRAKRNHWRVAHNCARARRHIGMVGRVGIEPTTNGLRVRCSTS